MNGVAMLESAILIASDVERTAAAYAAGLDQRPERGSDGMELHSGHDFTVIVTSAETLAEETGIQARRCGLAALCLATPDFDGLIRRAERAGATLEDGGLPAADKVVVRDPWGVPIILRRDTCRTTRSGERRHRMASQLVHLDILVPDLERERVFFEEAFGLKTVMQYRVGTGGFVYLADQRYRPGSHDFLLELVGPPDLEEREHRYLNAFGAGYDHLCYSSDNVELTYQRATASGFDEQTGPYQAYGGTLGWMTDPDGFEIEIVPRWPEMVGSKITGVLKGEPLIDRSAQPNLLALLSEEQRKR